MKNKVYLIWIFFIYVLLFSFLIPIIASSITWGWGALPISDYDNDVYRYNVGENPWEGTKGDYYDEIDIQTIIENSTGITITFGSTPIVDADHEYTIEFDVNSDSNSDYKLRCAASQFYMMRYSDYYYWDGFGWHPSSVYYFPYIISINKITIPGLSGPIPTFATSEIAVEVDYKGDSPIIYSDYAPNDPSPSGQGDTAPVPGFQWFSICLTIITLIGLIFIYHKRHRII
ncbi:MAG: hypothetical protein ACTSPY_05995 [Candidatus Helarchaeota archaeon]